MYTGYKKMMKKYTKIIPHTAMMNVAIIIAPINSNKFTDINLKKVKRLT